MATFSSLKPTFSQAAVVCLVASVTRGVLAFSDEIDDIDDLRLLSPDEIRLRLSRSLERDLDHWDSHVMQAAPARLKNEFRVIRFLLQETMKHQMSFGSAHGRPQ